MHPQKASHRNNGIACFPFKILIIVYFIFILQAFQLNGAEDLQRRNSFDFGWKFHLGDVQEADSLDFDDTNWRLLNLPHDWSIEGEYKESHPTGWRGGFLPTGIGWYRKSFTLDRSVGGKRVFLEFDGIYLNSDVYINGHHLGHRPNGYISFQYEISDFLNPNGENLVAVRVDHSKAPSGRWYTGSGIYRHTWIRIVNPVHVAYNGTYIRTEKMSDSRVKVMVDVDVDNRSASTADLKITHTVLDKQGQPVGSASTATRIPASGSDSSTAPIQLDNPDLWSPDNPTQYTLVTNLIQDGKVVDTYKSRFGIRFIEFSHEFGMKLNGKHIKVKGVCNHHDAGPVGSAVPNDVLRRRLQILKSMGCNAIRTAHNPYAPEFYDMCDELGILVMDEMFDGWEAEKAEFDYGLYFEDWWERDMQAWLKRDRNHPSIFIWSIGNEVKGKTAETQKKLVDLCHAMDPTRPVTMGGHNPRQTAEMNASKGAGFLDIKGFNGSAEEVGHLEKFHREYPRAVAIGTELPHSYQTRGVYRSQAWYRRRDFQAPWERGADWDAYANKVFPVEDLADAEVFPEETEKNYLSSYDNATVRISVRQSWQRTNAFDFMIGEFRWGGFDYLGETNYWPTRFHSFGVIDLCGFPKDHYYLLKSLWTEDPMVHVLPHWTHPGKEGVEIPVVVYTNCDEVELFLNDTSLEKKAYNGEQLVWEIPYEPGHIRAVAYKDGKIVCDDLEKTAGQARKVILDPDRRSVMANNRDVIHVEVTITDKFGTMVPLADNRVMFDISGPARLLGVENGDPLDHDPHKVPQRKAFRGKCLLILQATGEPGTIELRAQSEGLQPGIVKLLSLRN